MRRSKAVLLVPLLGLAPLHAFACYTVYDRTDRVLYYGDKPPVDMSRPLHETVPARFPGGHMVFDSRQCSGPGSVAFGAERASEKTMSPLLTDERTARAMNVPYRQLGRGVVVVDQKDAKMSPKLTVLPAYKPAVRAPARQAPAAEPELEFQPMPQQPQQRRY